MIKEQQPTPSFETVYARLEAILEKMSSGKISLEDSIKYYEEADQLINWCNKQLTEAEKKIEILVKGKEATLQVSSEGRPLTQPFVTTSNSL